MKTIKQIFDEIAAEPGSNMKMTILGKYKDNELLNRVLYLAKSRRVKFYIKQIPEYTTNNRNNPLEEALDLLGDLSSRNLTGHDAIEHLSHILSCVSSDDAYVIERIIDKSLKIGMGTSNINKVFKDLIEKTPYMGAKSFSIDLAKKIFNGGKKAFIQKKMDGRYCNAIVRGGDAEMESRDGEPTILDNAKFLTELSYFDDCVLNGELTMDGVSRYISNGIIASLIDITKKRESRTEDETVKKVAAFEKKHEMKFDEALDKIRFTVWDTITVDEYFAKKSKTPYHQRIENLGKLIIDAFDKIDPNYEMEENPNTGIGVGMISVVDGEVVESYEEAMTYFQKMLNLGEEGAILKSWDGEWKNGKPATQVKMKLDMNIDLRIIGFEYGTKNTKNEHVISTLNTESSCGLLKTNPSGMKEVMMVDVTERQEELLGTIVEVNCSGLSQNSSGEWSVLHPSVEKLRNDKDTCDSLEDIKEIEAMAKGLK